MIIKDLLGDRIVLCLDCGGSYMSTSFYKGLYRTTRAHAHRQMNAVKLVISSNLSDSICGLYQCWFSWY